MSSTKGSVASSDETPVMLQSPNQQAFVESPINIIPKIEIGVLDKLNIADVSRHLTKPQYLANSTSQRMEELYEALGDSPSRHKIVNSPLESEQTMDQDRDSRAHLLKDASIQHHGSRKLIGSHRNSVGSNETLREMVTFPPSPRDLRQSLPHFEFISADLGQMREAALVSSQSPLIAGQVDMLKLEYAASKLVLHHPYYRNASKYHLRTTSRRGEPSTNQLTHLKS